MPDTDQTTPVTPADDDDLPPCIGARIRDSLDRNFDAIFHNVE